jgi:hypothetical protein
MTEKMSKEELSNLGFSYRTETLKLLRCYQEQAAVLERVRAILEDGPDADLKVWLQLDINEAVNCFKGAKRALSPDPACVNSPLRGRSLEHAAGGYCAWCGLKPAPAQVGCGFGKCGIVTQCLDCGRAPTKAAEPFKFGDYASLKKLYLEAVDRLDAAEARVAELEHTPSVAQAT